MELEEKLNRMQIIFEYLKNKEELLAEAIHQLEIVNLVI